MEPFYGNVTQCFKCLKFGHISKQCRSTANLCIICAKTKDENHVCTSNDRFCVHCKSNEHSSNYRKCPSFQTQRGIRKIMVDNNPTFKDAKRVSCNSFAGIITSNRFSELSESRLNLNFPPLPENSAPCRQSAIQKKPSKPFLSQPSTSRVGPSSMSNKKRKLQSQSPSSIMFPFTFGPSVPLPPTPKNPLTDFETEKKHLSESIAQYIYDLISKICKSDDIHNCSFDVFKNGMSLLISKTFNLHNGS